MPYFIKQTAEGWDTVKDDGTVLGKHKTKSDAIKQMVAVSIAEKIPPGGELKRAVPSGEYQPPVGVAVAAKRALKWISEGKAGSGFTAVGRRRASQLASGVAVSADVVNRMLSYFARHEVDKQATGFNAGEDGFPSAGRVAWDAWGGDAGQSWVNGLDSKLANRATGSIGISDFDDTLNVNGQLHQDYYEWLDHEPVALYIVTGRDESERQIVADWLEEHNVQYQQLITRPSDMTDTPVWKGLVASNLLKDGYKISFAVDNDPKARAEYKKAGVTVVYDPKSLPLKMTATRDAYEEVEPLAMEAVEPTRQDLADELRELLGNVVAVKFLAHGAHWNVKGILFSQFHEFFEDIYKDYDSMIDPLAENIRKLDVDAPFMLPQFVADTEVEATFVGGDPVQLSLAIYKANEIVKGDVVEVLCTAEELAEQGIYNFLADLQDRMSKWHWQLGAVIGPELANAYFVDPEEVEEVHSPDVMQPNMPSEDVVDSDVLEMNSRFVEPNRVAELHQRGERVDKGIEQRVAVNDLEIREEGNGMTLRGYAAVFNSASQPLPFTERIQPGAFRDSLKSRNDIKLLWNHDTGIVLGSTRAGTLKLTEDNHGLLVEAQLPDTQAGRDAATLIKRGDVTGFSFGFRVPVGGDEWPSASERVLKRVNVHEVSVGVAFPAYLATEGTANVRSMNDLPKLIAKLAELRGVSAEELTEALLALESGEELTERQGELLTETLSKVLTKDEQINNASALLELKKKELDLLMKRV